MYRAYLSGIINFLLYYLQLLPIMVILAMIGSTAGIILAIPQHIIKRFNKR